MTRLDRDRQERLRPIPGSPPSLINVPSGCAFNPRCTYRHLVPNDACTEVVPEILDTTPGHGVRCHLPIAQRREIFADEVRPTL